MEEKHKPENQDILISLDRLISSVDKLTAIQNRVYRQNKIGFSVLRGIGYGLGSTVGLALILALIFFLLKSIGLFDNLEIIFRSLNDVKDIYN